MSHYQNRRPRHTNLLNEIETTEPNTDRTNNIIIGLAVGVMIVLCAGILVFGLVAEELAY